MDIINVRKVKNNAIKNFKKEKEKSLEGFLFLFECFLVKSCMIHIKFKERVKKNMAKLILLRHGQSEWNKLNLFTGWVDIPLSKEGIEESILAGKILSECNVDIIYVSSLIRSQMTALIVMAYSKFPKMPCMQHDKQEFLSSWYEKGCEEVPLLIPMYKAWELNERMYGSLQAKSKEKIMEEHGKEQVKLWRRSYDTCPPEGESLAQTAQRSIPFFENKIVSDLKKGLDVFVCAHGNSLRSIVMSIESLSKDQVLELEISTGVPIIYEYSQGLFKKKME